MSAKPASGGMGGIECDSETLAGLSIETQLDVVLCRSGELIPCSTFVCVDQLLRVDLVIQGMMMLILVDEDGIDDYILDDVDVDNDDDDGDDDDDDDDEMMRMKKTMMMMMMMMMSMMVFQSSFFSSSPSKTNTVALDFERLP